MERVMTVLIDEDGGDVDVKVMVDRQLPAPQALAAIRKAMVGLCETGERIGEDAGLSREEVEAALYEEEPITPAEETWETEGGRP